jgi:hypothetical protein
MRLAASHRVARRHEPACYNPRMMRSSPLRVTESNRRAAERMQARLGRRTLTQIYLPLLLGGAAMVGLLLLLGARSGGGLSSWSNLAATILGLVLLAGGLIGILIAVGLSILASLAIRAIPPYADILQGWLEVLAARVAQVARILALPAVWARSATAAARHVANAAVSGLRPPDEG